MLLLLLILANLLFFVWAQGFLGTVDEGREPQRLGGQIVPERLQATVIDPTPVAANSPAEFCRLVTGLAPNVVQRLLVQLELPGLRFAIPANASPSKAYWVYVPPLPYRLAAEKKLAELNKLGVVNASVILEEGVDKHAITLGFFDAEQLANEYLQELGKRGVKSARMQVRENPRDKTRLEVRGTAEMLSKHLPELLSGQVDIKFGDCAAER